MNKKFLKELLKTHSPSGMETEGVECFLNYLGDGNVDKIGNGIVKYGEGKHSLLLSGHIDEIGLRIQNIDEKGFIYFVKNGGTDAKVLLGSTVTILNRRGKVKGIIGKAPIHIETAEERKTINFKKMKIDIGVSSKAEAQKLVEIGDIAIVDGDFIELNKSRFVSRGLDDKLGVFIVAEVIKRLQENEENNFRQLKNLTIYASACTQEETGGSGAVNLGKLNPEFSIDYDVHFASDDNFVSANEYGNVVLGEGGAICHSVDCNHKLVNIIKDACDENGIPYQSFSKGSGGTNTIKIKNSAFNCETALLSIPLRNMHTQVEMADYHDLQCLIDMTLATIYKIDEMLND
jgi:endoglucanase